MRTSSGAPVFRAPFGGPAPGGGSSRLFGGPAPGAPVVCFRELPSCVILPAGAPPSELRALAKQFLTSVRSEPPARENVEIRNMPNHDHQNTIGYRHTGYGKKIKKTARLVRGQARSAVCLRFPEGFWCRHWMDGTLSPLASYGTTRASYSTVVATSSTSIDRLVAARLVLLYVCVCCATTRWHEYPPEIATSEKRARSSAQTAPAHAAAMRHRLLERHADRRAQCQPCRRAQPISASRAAR